VNQNETSPPVVAYIDGFNVYNGLRAADLGDCRWLDWITYISTLIDPGESLRARYFTAVVNTPPDVRTRQQHYLRALRSHGGLEITEGQFMARSMRCPSCNHRWKRPKEKYTDVNIAIAMVDDAVHHCIKRALLVSGDSDLVPAVHYLKELGIEVVNVIPPRRKSDDLATACSAILHVDPLELRKAQLPNPVMESYRGGRKVRPLRAPDGWT
jgi:uncharacterized LabA/DUF88 family protein